jgi:hypothetical protein
MSMTPEERAKEIYDIAHEALWHVDAIPLIASAITQAEDEALERAAKLLDDGHDEAWGNPAEQAGWSSAARTIRNLKSQETGE